MSAGRRLEEPFAYLALDAQYERVREGGIADSRAVPVAVGIDGDGRRRMLAVELASRREPPILEGLPARRGS